MQIIKTIIGANIFLNENAIPKRQGFLYICLLLNFLNNNLHKYLSNIQDFHSNRINYACTQQITIAIYDNKFMTICFFIFF